MAAPTSRIARVGSCSTASFATRSDEVALLDDAYSGRNARAAALLGGR